MEENNPWFDSLFLNSPIPKFIYNSQTLRIARVNNAAIQLYGYSHAEFGEMTINDLRRGHDIDCETVKNIVTDDDIFVCEVEHSTKNNQLIWVQMSAHQIDYRGVPCQLVQALNITDRKTIEQQVNRVRKRYQALIEHSDEIITVTDPEGKIMYVSPAFCKTTGYASADVIGRPGKDFLHPDLHHLFPGLKEELLLHPDRTIPMINRLKCKDETYVYVEGTISNLLQEESVHGFVSNYRNVTQRLQNEKKLKQSEAILRAVFDSAIEGFVITDTHLNIQAFNKVAKHYTFSNTKRSELVIGKSLLDYVSSERQPFFKGMVPRLMAGENFEYRMVDASNGKRWINYTLYPVQNGNREIIGICIAGKDVTERINFEEKLRVSEQKYKALVKEGSDLINIVDEGGNYKFIAMSSKSTLDRTAVGQNAFEYVHEDDRAQLIQEFDQLRKVKRVKSSPYRFKVADDKYIWMETTATNLLDDPAIEGIVINSHDVTQTIERIKAIEDRNARLEEIAWIQSHLVRAPLASILGIIEILKSSEADFPEFMPYLEQSATQLDKVISEITRKASGLTT